MAHFLSKRRLDGERAMTTISGNMAGAMALDMTAAGLGAQLGLMAGMMSVSVGQMRSGVFQPSGQPFTASMSSSDQASIDLGDGNTLVFDKSNSQMQIVDAQGNTTTIWGDPHLMENGQNVGTFYGPTTFQLQDGTKITIDTQAGTEGTGVTYANTVTVTRGSNAVVVGNLDQENSGGLTLSSSQNGRALDAATPDGLVLNQASGGNWTSALTGQDVTQADLNMTKPGGEAAIQFGQAMGAMLGQFLTMGIMSEGLAAMTHGDGGVAHHADNGHRPPLLSLFAQVSL
jgi:hypothetical protein